MVDEKTLEQYELPQIALLKKIDLLDLLKASYDELLQYGIDANEIKGYTQWILGKIADRITNPPSEKLQVEGEETSEGFIAKRGALKEYAIKIGVAHQTLIQYGSIYRKFIAENPDFHPLKYHGSVPWGVLALVASKTETPAALLEMLMDKGVTKSIEQVAFYLKENPQVLLPEGSEQTESEQGTVENPIPKPTIKLEWEPDKKKYRLVMNPDDFPKIDWSLVKHDLSEWLEGLS